MHRNQLSADAARELLGRTPFATPEPIAIGEPGAGYPLPWSVQTWLLVRRIWAALRDLPRTASDVMTHGDLIPGNVLVTKGRLVGIIDVGGLGPADPALDLVGAWHLLEDGPRQALREDLASDDLEWARGMAWAFEQAMGLIWYYADSNPTMSRMGQRTLARLLGSDDL
jgi:aminoglycoside phosphotransferase (APT) family kinase protein